MVRVWLFRRQRPLSPLQRSLGSLLTSFNILLTSFNNPRSNRLSSGVRRECLLVWVCPVNFRGLARTLIISNEYLKPCAAGRLAKCKQQLVLAKMSTKRSMSAGPSSGKRCRSIGPVNVSLSLKLFKFILNKKQLLY